MFTIFLAVFGLFNSVFMAFRKTQYVLIKDVATNVGKIFLLLFFVPFLYMGIFYSVGIGTIVGIIICFFFSYKTKLIKKFKLNINFNILIKNWKYIFRNYFIVLSSYLPSLFFPILVLEILSAETNAYFYITWTIFSLITMLGMSITGSLFVEGSYREDKIKKNTTKGLKALLVIATISILGVFLFGKFIFSLFGEEYLNSLDLLYVFMASIYLFLINKLYLIILLLKMRINGALIFNFLISGSTIIFGTLLMFYFGLIGVGYGWLIGQAIGIIWIFIHRQNFHEF